MLLTLTVLHYDYQLAIFNKSLLVPDDVWVLEFFEEVGLRVVGEVGTSFWKLSFISRKAAIFHFR